MKLSDDTKRAHAAMLFNDALFNEIMDGMETAAINTAMYAKPTEHDVRHASLTEARAIRELCAKLKSLAARKDAE